MKFFIAGVSTGGDPACYIIENHLSRFVEGEDPRNVERIWDQMFRSTLNYGRKGLPMLVLRLVSFLIKQMNILTHHNLYETSCF